MRMCNKTMGESHKFWIKNKTFENFRIKVQIKPQLLQRAQLHLRLELGLGNSSFLQDSSRQSLNIKSCNFLSQNLHTLYIEKLYPCPCWKNLGLLIPNTKGQIVTISE